MSCFLFFSSSFFRRVSSLLYPVPSISLTLLYTTSVNADMKGTSKSFVLSPWCLPFPSPCSHRPPAVPLTSLRFFACRLNFMSAYSRKFTTTREWKGKSQMEISYSLKSSLKVCLERMPRNPIVFDSPCV